MMIDKAFGTYALSEDINYILPQLLQVVSK